MRTPVIEEQIYQEGIAEEPLCRHHWVIESPHGATSHGICKRVRRGARLPELGD